MNTSLKSTGNRDGSARILAASADPEKPRTVSIIACDITERRKAAEKLRKSEALLAQAAQLGSFGCWELDLETNTRIWSDETFRLLGLDPEKTIPSRTLWYQMVHPDDRERVAQAADRAIANRVPFDHELRLVRSDGEVRMLHVRAVPFSDEAGNAVRIIGMVQDITERKRAEEKLRQSETLLAQAGELAKMGSWTRDLKSNSAVWSDEMYRILGVTPTGAPIDVELFWQMIHPDDREKARRGREEAIAQHRPLDIEFRCVLPDGGIRVIHRRAIPVYDENGEAVRLVGMAQDVTERKNEEERLRTSEALLAEAEEMANLGSWEFIPKTRAATLSKQLLRMYGFGPGEAWDESRYWDSLEPIDRARVREITEKAISESKEFAFRVPYRMPDGTTRVYTTRGIPVPGADGVAERIYGIVRDVTEQQQQEANLHHLSQELIRIRDTERRQTAIELHETVGQSLASLKMCLGRLREALPEDDERSRGLVRDSMNLAEDAVREVRVVSYLMHPAMLDEGGLSPALRWLVRGFSERSGIEVKFEIPEHFERCPRDIETAVFRIVQESLTNIHRYSGSRTARIRVEREAGVIRVEVQDAGCGLPPPLKRGEPAGFSGVGIAGMRERVRQLNGQFAIESAPGRGTLVRALLPLSTEAVSNSAGHAFQI